MQGTNEAKANILVVDDTVENLQLLSRILTKEGYEVRIAPNGVFALQAVEADPPDLILLDVTMPHMSGYDVCKQLKAQPSSNAIPVIFISALHETIDKVTAFGAGAVDYVTKPFQVDEVVARVRTHLELQRTQRKLEESYRALRKLESVRDNLVHMIVHDLRSPLTALMCSISLLKDGATPLDVESAEQSTRVMMGMVNELLDVSRLEQERMPIDSERNDLVELVRRAIENVRHIDSAREIVVRAERSVEVSCDKELIRRVIENLVGNGIKHTPPGLPLLVSVSAQHEPRVSVEDRGPGVPAAYRETIFEKFGIVEARRNREYHSTGLGLAFCKLAVEAHGGQIGVSSEEGRGSTFWFTLPTLARASRPAWSTGTNLVAQARTASAEHGRQR
ncbi:MAG TPA: hybrid sensor histidine kinase/response regulator [Polyangiales bacterium]|nr:hybrid sensor histidine kinase/response regulator [Polyangiales bacterium]